MRYRQTLTWEPLPEELAPVQSRLEAILQPWDGTPYMKGQQRCQVGADCVRFVTAVLDELWGFEREIPRLPQDSALHSPETARAALRYIMGLYPRTMKMPLHRTVQPGDILITGETSGGPGHAIIVGASPNSLWQALPTGIHKGGMALMVQAQRLFRIYRFEDRHAWLR